MKPNNLYLLILVFTTTLFGGQKNELAVTVYNNNLALVREIRSIELKKGVQEFRFVDVAARIDPTSVHFKSITDEKSINLLEQNFEYDLVGKERLLEKYVDQEIVVATREGNVFHGTLLASKSGDIILQNKDGAVFVVNKAAIENVQFPSLPEGLITRPTLVWLLDCAKAGKQNSEISYLTKGISWHAEYVAVTNEDDTQLEMSGWVSIDNKSGATYKQARLKLVAGDVNIIRKQQRSYTLAK